MSGAKYYWDPSNKREEFKIRRIHEGDVFELRDCFGNCSIKACYEAQAGDLYLAIGYENGIHVIIANTHNLVDEHDANAPTTRFVDFMRIGKNTLTDLLRNGKMTFEDIVRADRKKMPASYRDQFFDDLSKLLEKYFDFPADMS